MPHLPPIHPSAFADLRDPSVHAAEALDDDAGALAESVVDALRGRLADAQLREVGRVVLAVARALPLAASPTEGATPARELELARRIAALQLDLPNPALGPEALACASNFFDLLGGASQRQIAERHGISRTCFNDHVIILSDALQLPPSRGMRSHAARQSYRERAHASHGTPVGQLRSGAENPWRGNPIAAATRLKTWAAARPWGRLAALAQAELAGEMGFLDELRLELAATADELLPLLEQHGKSRRIPELYLPMLKPLEHAGYFRQLGARGGRAGRGKAKARSSQQMRAAACARWARQAKKAKIAPPSAPRSAGKKGRPAEDPK